MTHFFQGVAVKAHKATSEIVMIWCPGCDSAHGPNVSPGRWTFNGDLEKPTFSPSLLVTYSGGDASAGLPAVCHSFVTDGRIQFLNDSTHALAGQTVDLPEWPESWS